MGAVKFLIKPLDFDALIAELRAHLTLTSDIHPCPYMAQTELAPSV